MHRLFFHGLIAAILKDSSLLFLADLSQKIHA
jgi:hypothetical protein